jgi:hypothetical protein
MGLRTDRPHVAVSPGVLACFVEKIDKPGFE